jgi:Na+-driven multidrug efflux pump
MAENKDDGLGLVFLAFGIMFIVVGLTLIFYEIMLSLFIPDMYRPHLFAYPYQFVGIIIALLGTVLTIVGAYRWKQRKNKIKSET